MGPLYGVPADRAAAVTGAHLTTVRRWKRLRRAPGWVSALVELCIAGELDRISRTWRGWRIRGELLISPEGWEFTPGAIRAIPLKDALIRSYQQKQRCVQQADWIDERWVTPAQVNTATAPAGEPRHARDPTRLPGHRRAG